MMKNKITRSAYEYKLAELERLEREILDLEESKKTLAQDGTDDENPAYGYNNQQLVSAYGRRNELKAELNHVTIVEPEKAGEGEFSEYAKSITIRSEYPDDGPEIETLIVGRDGFNCISPASPLFKFLHGQKVGFKGIFRHTGERIGEVAYEVEILDIAF